MCVTLAAATLRGLVLSSVTHSRRAIPLQHPMNLFIKRLPKFPGGNNEHVKRGLVSLVASRKARVWKVLVLCMSLMHI